MLFLAVTWIEIVGFAIGVLGLPSALLGLRELTKIFSEILKKTHLGLPIIHKNH